MNRTLIFQFILAIGLIVLYTFISTRTFKFLSYLIITGKEENTLMKSYVCTLCGYVYDPAVGDEDNGVAPGTAFEAIPEEWVCPLCGAGKDQFEVE